MVALSLLGIALVALFHLFSTNLRSVKQSEDYSSGLIHARSIMDDTLALPKLTDGLESFNFEDGFKATRTTSLKSSDEKVKVYEITVTVSWPPSGSLELKSLKTYYETEE